MTPNFFPLHRLGGAIVLITFAAAARSDNADPMSWRLQCPAAAAWMDANPAWQIQALKQRDSSRGVTHPELLTELQRRVDADQAARQRVRRRGFAQRDVQAAAAVDVENQRWLVWVINQSGFPTASQVGEYGLHLTWLLVHHADQQPELQRRALVEFQRRHDAGEFSATDLARLTDRVLKKRGGLQAFGTQFDWAAGVDSQIRQIANLAEIERNRQALGLMPLADYGCMMHAIRKPRDH